MIVLKILKSNQLKQQKNNIIQKELKIELKKYSYYNVKDAKKSLLLNVFKNIIKFVN